MDDKNMFYAYGGADLNVTGTVVTAEIYDIFLIFSVRTDWKWAGSVNVSLGDEWIFKEGLVRERFDSYKAGRWLQENCGYKPFYHKMEFKLSWDWEGAPDTYSGGMVPSPMI